MLQRVEDVLKTHASAARATTCTQIGAGGGEAAVRSEARLSTGARGVTMRAVDEPAAPEVQTREEQTREVEKPRRSIVLLAPLVPIVAVLLVWYFADLGSLRSPERVAEAARALRESELGFVYVLAAFAAGTLVFFPVTALIVGTTLAFDPLRGFAYAFSGALLGTAITYGVGRLVGSGALDYVAGPRIRKFQKQLARNAFRAGIIARILPVGNFTAINLLAGSIRVPFRAFMLGNVLGILPGVLAFTFFAGTISKALRSPDKGNMTLAVVGALLVVALMFGLRVWSKRRERALAREGAAQ